MDKIFSPISIFLFIVTLTLSAENEIPDGFAVLTEKSGLEIEECQPAGNDKSDLFISSDDKARGFIAGVADTTENISNEKDFGSFLPGKIKLFGTRGEYRNFLIAVKSLKNLNKLDFKISGFECGNEKISLANIDIRRFVVYKNQKEKGHFLEKDFPFSIKSGNTAWIWGTIFIPENAKPGNYESMITIFDADDKNISFPLRLLVLDFQLDELYGNWGLVLPGHFADDKSGNRARCSEYMTKENLDIYFKFLKTIRFNSTFLFHIYPELKLVNGKLICNFSDLSLFAESIKKNAMNGYLCIDTRFIEWGANTIAQKYEKIKSSGKEDPQHIDINGMMSMPAVTEYSQFAIDLYSEAIRQLLKTAEKKKWPEIILMPEEEVGNGGAVKPLGYETFTPVLKKITPGKILLVDNDIGYGRKNAIDRGARDNIKYRQYNSWEDEALEKAKADGAEIWSYNNEFTRATYGLFQQRLGSTGYHQWADHWKRGNYVYSIITATGVISSTEFEQVREGRFDWDYCNTLKIYAEKLEKAGFKNESKSCKKRLTSILSQIPVNKPGFGQWRSKKTSCDLDTMRWALVVEIQKARKILKEKVMDITPDSGTPCLAAIVHRDLNTDNTNNRNILMVPYVNSPVDLDAVLNEDCWNGNENSTGPLSWMKSKEIAMRAYASSEEEFREMPRPSYANASFAYNNKGLYIGVRSNHVSPETDKFSTHSDDDADLWKDNCMEFFFKLPDGEIYHLVVNTCGKKLFMRGSKVLNSSEIKVVVKGNVNTSGGSAQEIFIPWHIWGFGNVPNPNSSWLANVGREHHSFKQFTTWGKVYESFWETENWGMLTFSATSGIADIKPDEFCLFPGKSRVTGRIVSKEISNIATGEFLLNMKDASGKTVSSTILKSKGKSPEFCMEYFIPSLDKQEEWCLELKDNSGQELASLRFPISVFKNTIAINSIPDFIASGNSFPIDAMLCVGNLDISDSLLKAEFVSKDNGKVFAVREIVPSMNGECRIWVDSSGIPAGKYVFRIWLSRKSGEDAAFEKEMEVLPSY